VEEFEELVEDDSEKELSEVGVIASASKLVVSS
jgi:hypothetical protein